MTLGGDTEELQNGFRFPECFKSTQIFQCVLFEPFYKPLYLSCLLHSMPSNLILGKTSLLFCRSELLLFLVKFYSVISNAWRGFLCFLLSLWDALVYCCLNSSLIDELGNWCHQRLIGAPLKYQAQQEGSMANLWTGTSPASCHQTAPLQRRNFSGEA